MLFSTRFTKVIGKPPLIMAGMTPTTSLNGIELVAACTSAGYLGELAGGGLVLPEYFQAKVNELTTKIPPGSGIALNLLYLNAHLWGFQFPMVQELARAGYPIESVTVAAGIPSKDKASEIISQLHECGVRYVAFKPGTAQAIRDCLSIADEAKTLGMFVVIQWTGGRGGGHHSFEDFHEPLLETYGAIRALSNVLLVVGSGFGDAEGSFPYLTGEWAVQFNRPKMPCDAVLLGSRCMVAKESSTAREVKELIILTPGVHVEREWEMSYKSSAGGIITLTSELGEPIHKIGNRGMSCWRDFDRDYFSLPKGSPERLDKIIKNKEKIISRLNADFQKVFFGRKVLPNGMIQSCDLEQMTYGEVVGRMIELMFVENGKTPRLDPRRWIDMSYQTRTFVFLTRAERRFRRESDLAPAIATDVSCLRQSPKEVLSRFLEAYPAAHSTLLSDDDVSFFVTLCRESRFGKPVNFVPVIDAELDFWVKKDSLWYSEDLDAVPDRDPGRVCILQGPLAVRHSESADEPIADILNNIHSGWCKLLLARGSNQDSKICEAATSLDVVSAKRTETTFPFLKDLPPSAWQRVVLSLDSKIVRGNRWTKNYLTSLFQVAMESGEVITCDESSISCSQVSLRRTGRSFIDLQVRYDIPGSSFTSANVVFNYQPDIAFAPLLEREIQTKPLYKAIWVKEDQREIPVSVMDMLKSSVTLSDTAVRSFNEAICRVDALSDLPLESPSVDFGIVCGWEPLIRTLFSKEIEGDLLRLVHLSHGFRLVQPRVSSSPSVGDVITSKVRVTGIEIVRGVGKKISCFATLERTPVGSPSTTESWMEITSSFLIRGVFEDYTSCFLAGPLPGEEQVWIKLESELDCTILRGKPWFKLTDDKLLKSGAKIRVDLERVFQRRLSESVWSDIQVNAVVLLNGRKDAEVGVIDFQSAGPLSENPVMSYLHRQRFVEDGQAGTMLESGGATLLKSPEILPVPSDPARFQYGIASGDVNPIHSSRYFAALASLKDAQPIVHGMWTFALARQMLERGAADGDASRIFKFEADFVGMLRFGQTLAGQLTMIGVISGRKLIKVELTCVETNELVLRGRGEVDQPSTAYLFTGQGSASVGMGMDRYEENEAVKGVWDRADAHLLAKYGFSLLRIVRENPKEFTVHFGGTSGRQIRDNYRAIRVTGSSGEATQLLPEIAPDTKSFTFRSGGEGLLFATQFAQPALVVIQKAAFQELVDGGMIPRSASFAGHSLGEYAGLAAFADVLSIEDLVETVFLRGMVMQNAVKRDARGRSDFAMVAVNPSRVKVTASNEGAGRAITFRAEDLLRLVDALAQATGDLLQVVNYNVRGLQYVVAGHVLALDVLEQCLSSGDPTNFAAIAIERAKRRIQHCKENDMPFELMRGSATIPLPGIDVPFHSRQLLPGVPAFRELLTPRLPLDRVGRMLNRLIGKYIPNVTAKYFRIDLDYVELSAKATGSSTLFELAKRMQQQDNGIGSATIARTLLIELLAHQFAMPVLWIDTQDLLFRSGMKRVIEMGPAPTLVGMAQRTLEMAALAGIRNLNPEILWWGRDMATIMYANLESKGPTLDVFVPEFQQQRLKDSTKESPEASEDESESAPVSSELSKARAVKPSSSSPPVPKSGIAPSMNRSSGPMIDQQISAKHCLKVLLASKLKRSFKDIADSSSIKSLSQGKSAVQNELVGDVASEFNLSQDGLSPETTVSDIASKASLGYKQLGKVATQLISRTLAAKLPGDFPASSARTYLASRRLSASTIEFVLLHGCGCLSPGARLSNKDEAQRWLDTCLDDYAKEIGVDMSSPSSQGTSVEDFVDYSGDSFGDSGGGGSIPDVPPSAGHVIQALVATKLRMPIEEVKLESTLKSLSQGKSAVQNELVGDLQGEFPGGDTTGLAETSLGEMAKKMSTGYKQLGKVSSQLLSRTLSAKLPANFGLSLAREYLGGTHRLGPSMTESALLHAATMAPTARLGSMDEGKQWLDLCVSAFAKHAGIDLSGTGTRSSSRRANGGTRGIVSSEALKAHEKRLADLFESQTDAISRYLNKASFVTSPKDVSTDAQAALASLRDELGDSFIEGVRPLHDARKVREYDSYWNWVIQDALDMHLHVLAALKLERGETGIIVPNSGNLHFRAMASWITSVASGRMDKEPPQEWFRNFLCNRATKELLMAVEYFARNMLVKGYPEYAQMISLLAEQVEAWVDHPPVLVTRANHHAPRTIVTPQGKIEYVEVPRDGAETCAQYVESLAGGATYSKDDVTFDPTSVPNPSQSLVLDVKDAPLTTRTEEEEESTAAMASAKPEDNEDDDAPAEGSSPQSGNASASSSSLGPRPQGPLLEAMRDTVVRHGADVALRLDFPPLVHLRSGRLGGVREYDPVKTAQYLSCMHALATRGVSFANQVVLVTGAGAGSIAVDVIKLLLEGGAIVISALNYAKSEAAIQETIQVYRRIYEEHGSKGSRLITEPMNAGSSQDVANLVDHIYNSLHLDIDFVIPFAALPERGRDISRIDSESELAHRAMLTNVIRLLGKVRDAKQHRGITTRPALVLIPCSPNHGAFGGDGLYAESKLGLEALMDKWRSEGWQNYLSLAACVIGWTRSALMVQNNIVAQGVEELGCRTFSTTEMAVNLVTLMHPRMVTLASDEPLWADLTGGWEKVREFDSAVRSIRESLHSKAMAIQTIAREESRDHGVIQLGATASTQQDADRHLIKRLDQPGPDVPLTNVSTAFPTLPKYENLAKLNMKGAVDLEKVVCIVGFGEVGPWGSSRTRWEMEAFGHFSLEGCVELAWMVGLIEHHDGPLASNPRIKYVGWIDAKTKEPVMDHEVKRRFEETILAHCGVRILEPELFEGYNPDRKMVWTKVGFERDLPIVEAASPEQALEIQNAVGGPDKCEIVSSDESAGIKIRIKAGAVLAVPRAFQFNRFVAGQIPTGWSAERLGIPPDIARAVDPVTLYALVSTMEAFVAAGVCDPYELYSYVHVTQVGNVSGGGMGGMRSLKRMFTDRSMDDPEVPSDTLAESFINTMPAWVNMLLLSSSGPIKTPVGACATAAESVEIGVETILSGKARVVVCGGYDDFGEVGSFEFAQMGATQDNSKDRDRGRRPNEASRPMTSTRSGFVESHGAGMQVLMDAKLAVEMGCPIYGIVALTNTATDREGRSIPAPGRGILTTARERKAPIAAQRVSDIPSSTSRDQALDKEWRLQELQLEMHEIDDWETRRLAEEPVERQDLVRAFANKKRTAAWETWGQGFYKSLLPEISPLTGALAVWGLTVDDIGVVSCHGTSTLLNDKNESSVVQKQFEHLGRTPGNICLVVAQKWLTAHPKGAAAAWMLNGALQILNSGVVPGNRNLDNCAEELKQFPFLFYPNRSISLSGIDAVLLKSFGFGQAGAEILVVHPNRVLAALSEQEFNNYQARRNERNDRTYRYWQAVFTGKHGLIRVKTRAPYLVEQETTVYLDPTARAIFDKVAGTWIFKDDNVPGLVRVTSSTPKVDGSAKSPPEKMPARSSAARVPAETRLKVTLEEQAEGLVGKNSAAGVGVDVEKVETFRNLEDRGDFIVKNFSSREIEYCTNSADSAASFAGRWAAKEAVVKALSSASPGNRSLWAGAHASLLDIEIVQTSSGAPLAELHGHASKVAVAVGVSEVKISISHTGDVAVAQAMALTGMTGKSD